MSTGMFLLILFVSIAALMLLIIKLKLHPVLALLVTALLSGIALGNPASDVLGMINSGFGSTLTGIGITIILGAILAMGIQDTGAAKSIANFFIRLFRGKNLELAPALTAFIVSIPVFGDVTMVLTSNIANILSRRKRISMSTMASFTGLGLFLTHALVPPTPGILAIAILLGADIGMVILWGIIIAIIGFLATWLILKPWTNKEYVPPIDAVVEGVSQVESSNTDDLLIKEEGLPGVFASFLTILIPVFLIAGSSFINMYADADAPIRAVTGIMGDRIVALGLGVLYTMLLGYFHKGFVVKNNAQFVDGKERKIGEVLFGDWTSRGLKVALSALLITGMGGAFGTVIRSASAIDYLGEMIANSPVPGILIPFLIGVIMMTAVGSMTVAGMTAAAIALPMLGALGLSPLAAALAIGSGTLMVNHVNNSGFWVMSQFFNLNTPQGLKYVTVPCIVASVVCFVCVAILSGIGVI